MATQHRASGRGWSIRLRLTAWYTVLLAVMLLALGVGLSELFERRLRNEVDDRLLETAVDVHRGFVPEDEFLRRLRIPPLDPFASPGLLIEVVDRDGAIRARSINLGDSTLPSANQPTLDPAPRYFTSTESGATVRVVDLPLVTTGRRYIGSVVVGESIISIDHALSDLRRLLLTGALPGLALVAIGGWLLAGRALRPVAAMTAAAARIATGENAASSLTTRLEVPRTGDEVARLASTFNAMLDRLESAFATQRRFVADASHELRTPLTAIRGNIEVLGRQLSAGGERGSDIDDAVLDISRESARMGRLLDDLLLLARTDAATQEPPLRMRPVDLDDVVEEAVRISAPLVEGQALRAISGAVPEIDGDPDRLLQLLLILIENALRHTPDTGEVTVCADAAEAGWARLMVRDTGEGILPEHLPHVFDRFYRADGARDRSSGGTGLGLAIAKAITELHGGQISVVSRPSNGATFMVRIPAATRTGGLALSEGSVPRFPGSTPSG